MMLVGCGLWRWRQPNRRDWSRVEERECGVGEREAMEWRGRESMGQMIEHLLFDLRRCRGACRE